MNNSNGLNCRPASPAQRVQAFENVFDVWRHAETLEEHLAKRLASAQHNRAEWFVGSLGERVVVSLGCYPMGFYLRGRIAKGIAIGAVHTLSEYRGRGYAAKLLSWVEEYQAGQGGEISLLFTDIGPRYYAKLGYTLCPALEGWIDLNATPPIGPAEMDLVQFSPELDPILLREAYENFHRGLPFSIARNEAYWDYLLQKGASHEFYWLIDSGNRRRGYVSLLRAEEKWSIQDRAIDERFLREAIAAVLESARRAGAKRVGGWMPETPSFAESFKLAPREREITMIKSLNDERKIDPEIQQAAGWIHEIDHV